MPRLCFSVPKYSQHKASNQAVVYLNSRCHYLGPWKTVENTWAYNPATHKTEHHGIDLVVFLGPKAQEIIKPFLRSAPSAYLFSSAESEEQRNTQRRRMRKSPITPSQARRKRRTDRLRPPGERYTVDSYRRAVERACSTLGIPAWTPGRLRHNAATNLRREFGLEAAQVVLGHQSATVTQLYAERNLAKAAEIMARVG